MAKNVLKEIIIILLLTLAIILLLGVLLYEYVPMNKVVPEAVTYTATEETRQALEEKTAQDSDEVILSYEVTSTDLKNYKKRKICMRGNVTLRLREEKSLTGMGKFWQQTGRYVQFL